VLSNDGAVLEWLDILQPPDPTGQSGKVIGSDGGAFVWQAPPSDGAPGANADVSVDSVSLRVGSGTGDRFLIQCGSDSAPASGTNSTQKSVTFPTAFKSIIAVLPVITSNSYNSVGFHASPAALNKSVTGFTFAAQVSAHQGGSGSDANIISDVPFDYVAFGTVAGA